MDLSRLSSIIFKNVNQFALKICILSIFQMAFKYGTAKLVVPLWTENTSTKNLEVNGLDSVIKANKTNHPGHVQPVTAVNWTDCKLHRARFHSSARKPGSSHKITPVSSSRTIVRWVYDLTAWFSVGNAFKLLRLKSNYLCWFWYCSHDLHLRCNG